jgi:pyrimidine operon attenuation protein/uracil phosphoribosyltransferase
MEMTTRLFTATQALAVRRSWLGVDESRVSLVEDVLSRARDITSVLRPESALTRPQIEYLQCLRSRLHDHELAGFAVATEWLDAYDSAWESF